jgi:sulfur-carrier protein adenylyltransferase/sulfurtransferase
VPLTATNPWMRQIALPGFGTEGQERLARARVVVAGAGGLGSAVLPVLAAAGVGQLVVVDPDAVEASNLHRQTLHTAADLGAGKAESAAATLAALVEGREGTGTVTAVGEAVDATNAARLIASADLIVDGTDSLAARYALDDAAAAAGIPLVWGSAVGYTGQVGVAWAGHGPRWRDLFPMPPAEDAVDVCAVAGVLPSVCTTIGGLMATEVLKLLTGVGAPLTGRVLVLDALAGGIREIAYAAADPTPAPDAARAVVPPSRGAHAYRATARVPREADGPAQPGVGARDTAPVAPRPAAEESDLLVTELADRIEDGEDVQLVDVREPWEAAIASLPGSLLVPLRQLPDRLGELDPSRPVITYCHAGVRSVQAAEFLREQGFRARSLAGGIDAWSRAIDPAVPRY